MPRASNQRGSLEAESLTDTQSPGLFHRTSSTLTTSSSRGRDNVNHVTQILNEPGLKRRGKPEGGGEVYDSDVSGGEEEEGEEEVLSDDAQPYTSRGGSSKQKKKSPRGSPRSTPTTLHPGKWMGRHKPGVQRLEDLPGVSVVSWEDFVDRPQVLGGLFTADRDDFLHYNPEQVNVLFHDPRLDQSALGGPSGDGLSWTIFIDDYSHLKTVRGCLTERVTVLLVNLHTDSGDGTAACLVALNPARDSVGDALQGSFQKATEAFIRQRNFCIQIDVNSCVQEWCRTALQLKCEVTGGRVVVTNGEERVPCLPVVNRPLCVLCLPVWGVQKLAYMYKRQSEYADIAVDFSGEDVTLCTESKTLKKTAENSSKRARTDTLSSVKERNQKSHRNTTSGASATSQTSASPDKTDPRGNLRIQKVSKAAAAGPEVPRPKHFAKGDKERGQDSGFSSDNVSTADRTEPQLRKTVPNYRPHGPGNVPPRPSDKRVRRTQHITDDNSSTSGSTLGSTARGDSALGLTWQVVQEGDDDEDADDDDSEDLGAGAGAGGKETDHHQRGFFSTATPVTGDNHNDLRARDVAQNHDLNSRDPAHGASSKALADQEEGYTLMDSPMSSSRQSPRPDTPYHPSLDLRSPFAASRGGMRRTHQPALLSQDSTIREEEREEGSVVKQRQPASSSLLQQGGGSGQVGELDLRRGEGGLYARDNAAFAPDDYDNNAAAAAGAAADDNDARSSGQLGHGRKAFPYTADYLHSMGTKGTKSKTDTKGTTAPLAPPPKYGLVDIALRRGAEPKRKNKGGGSTADADPAFSLFSRRDNDHSVNAAKGVYDVDDGDDLVSVGSELASSRQANSPKGKQAAKDWELASCDQEDNDEDGDDDDEVTGAREGEEIEGAEGEEGEAGSARSPPSSSGGILPGAKGAQQLRLSGELPENWRRGSQQYDSRRKYIALNSLRRKGSDKTLQANLRRQNQRSEAPSPTPGLVTL